MKRIKKHLKKIHDSKGLTLLELVIAALLLSATVAGLFGAFVTAHRWGTGDNTTAAFLAANRLEALAESVRADWWPVAGHPLSQGGPFADGANLLNTITYNRAYTVSDVAGRDYRRVDVSVQWNTN